MKKKIFKKNISIKMNGPIIDQRFPQKWLGNERKWTESGQKCTTIESEQSENSVMVYFYNEIER